MFTSEQDDVPVEQNKQLKKKLILGDDTREPIDLTKETRRLLSSSRVNVGTFYRM